jgi:hypothetical protein
VALSGSALMVLEQGLREGVELAEVLAEELGCLLVGLVDDPAYLVVDQLLRPLGHLARVERPAAVVRGDGDRPIGASG